jgi:DNA polymerase, archaea type
VKLVFWLLDINPKQNDGNIDIWLWGITKTGDRVLLIDHNFSTYFYAVLHGAADPALVAQKIGLRFSNFVAGTEIVSRRIFGKTVPAVKVTLKDASQTSKTVRQIRKLDGVSDCYEDDIRTAMRYLIDNNVVPCGWHEADVVEEENPPTVRAFKVYRVESPPKLVENAEVAPALRVLGFSIIAYSHEGTPKPERNPILMISTVDSGGGERLFSASPDMDDKAVIQDFVTYIREFDPDIIVSYGANTVDWNYLLHRSHQQDFLLGFDRASFEPHQSVYGHMSATGVVNVDLADFVGMFPEVKVKSLANISENLGVVDGRGVIDDVLFADYWDNPEKKAELTAFSLDNAHRVYGVASLMLDFAIQLSSLTILPLDHVMTAATGYRVESYLIKRAQAMGELVPRRVEQTYLSYAGGLVLSPKPGLHENIAVLDFKSMYPNVMITYNLSPDTYIQPGDPDPFEGVNIAPEVGYRFRKSPPGFYKEALTYLIDVRSEIRKKMKQLTPKTVEYQVLDARQKAVKILTNAAYGYAGWVGARWYIKPVAEAASAWGRHIILRASEMAKQAQIEVIYGDTDSLFIKYDKAKAEQLQADIKEELKLDVEIGEVYVRIFFTESKKRYAGLRQDGSLDIVGLEVIRGDWAEAAKQVQEHVLEIILKEQSPQKALEYVKGVVADVRHRRIGLGDLVIWKTLTKSPQEYAIRAPHVEAAKMLIAKGWRLSAGDKVGYVVLVGKGPLYSRVMPSVFAQKDQTDIDYYITNQVLPAAERILGFFNITQKDLELKTKEEKTRSLTDFF